MKSPTAWEHLITQRITVDPKRCISCGICIQVCPFMVYEIKKTGPQRKTAVPVYIEDCFLCQSCQAQCPADAITIEW